MTRPAFSLLASAALLAALAARAGAAQIVPGETAGAVRQALGSPDVLSQGGGPPNGQTEKYFSSGVEVKFLRGKVKTITVRRQFTPPHTRRPEPTLSEQAVVLIPPADKTPAARVLIGETAAAVREALGPGDFYMLNGPAGSQMESYFSAGLAIQYEGNRVSMVTVSRPTLLFFGKPLKPGKFSQAFVSVTEP